MLLDSQKTSFDSFRGFLVVTLSVFFVAAGGALAKNHDAQRIERHAASHAAKHDRAAGPLEASNAFDRSPD